MTNRIATGGFFLALTWVAGCGGASSESPTGPTIGPPLVNTPGSGACHGGESLTAATLFGVVWESTPEGPAPIPGATVYCDACGKFGHTFAETDDNGYYSFSGDLSLDGGIWLSGIPIPINVTKEGFADPPDLSRSACLPSTPGWREVRVDGDTRFDMQLVRQ